MPARPPQRRARSAFSRLALAALVLAALGAARPPLGDGPREVDRVRVRLLEQYRPQRLTLRAGDEPVAFHDGDDRDALVRLPAGETATLRLDAGRIVVERGGETFRAANLRVAPEAGGGFALTVPGGPGERRYEGALRVDADARRAGQMRLVHTVDLETYVAAVVQREYGMDDVEGSRAMAVVARTYALKSRGRYGPDYDVVDHVGSQVFFGLEGVRKRTLDAARDTEGEVLMWRGALAETVYSASSGGYTAGNDAVWNSTPLPYLRARPDPYDRVSPHAAWTTRLERDAVLAALSRGFGFAVSGFRLARTGVDGRVQAVLIEREGGQPHEATVSRFRGLILQAFGAMSLRSTRFTARRDGEAYVFDGSGFGHGVGLSQWGARGQALEGRSYREILGFYYPGTDLARLDGRGASDPLPLPTLDDLLPPETLPALASNDDAEPTRTPDAGAFEDEPVADDGVAGIDERAIEAAVERLRASSRAAEPRPAPRPAPQPAPRTERSPRTKPTSTVARPRAQPDRPAVERPRVETPAAAPPTAHAKPTPRRIGW